MKKDQLLLALVCGLVTGMLVAISVSIMLSLSWWESLRVSVGMMLYGGALGAVARWGADVFSSSHQQG